MPLLHLHLTLPTYLPTYLPPPNQPAFFVDFQFEFIPPPSIRAEQAIKRKHITPRTYTRIHLESPARLPSSGVSYTTSTSTSTSTSILPRPFLALLLHYCFGVGLALNLSSTAASSPSAFGPGLEV